MTLFYYRWYKFSENGRKSPVELGDRVKQVGGTLIIREAKVDDSGKYLCVVNNSVGGESVETVLTVTGNILCLFKWYFEKYVFYLIKLILYIYFPGKDIQN